MVENGSGTSRSRTGVDSSLLKRYGTLDEQAAAITFLASDEASDITGTVLPVAGGDLG
jgi:NAD(P)-dependent dehydrogenase (short-subunit alcohol dehydrogenase family)